jgi:hypothetical protein
MRVNPSDKSDEQAYRSVPRRFLLAMKPCPIQMLDPIFIFCLDFEAPKMGQWRGLKHAVRT